MTTLLAAQIAFFIQLFHGAEELLTGFHKKWFFVTLPFWFFLILEICLWLISFTAIFTNILPFKETLLRFYLLLMFANGVEHVVWYMWSKKYNPGLVTAVLHVVWFTYFYVRK